MLKLEYLFENFDLARAALAHYAHDPDRLDESLSWFRISSNAVYPYFHQGELHFLRLCPAAEKQLADIAAEIEFIRYLRSRDYPAMEPISSLSGALWGTISTPWGDYHMSAFKRVPGKAIEDVPLTQEILRAYGSSLGRMHRLSADFTPTLRRPTYEDVAEVMRTALPGKLHPVLAEVVAQLSRLPRTKETYGLVHYDYEPDNVFCDEATQQISIIDFDDSLYHFYALDVEQALDSLGELVPPADFPQARAVFLDGYRSEHPLPPEMEAAFPLMRQFINLRACARLHTCLDSQPKENPAWLTALTARLTARRDKLEAQLLRQ